MSYSAFLVVSERATVLKFVLHSLEKRAFTCVPILRVGNTNGIYRQSVEKNENRAGCTQRKT